MAYLNKSIQQKSDLGQAYRDLGKLYMKTHDPERALAAFTKVARISPDEPSIHYLLFQVDRKLGKSAEANEQMKLFERLKKGATCPPADAGDHRLGAEDESNAVEIGGFPH